MGGSNTNNELILVFIYFFAFSSNEANHLTADPSIGRFDLKTISNFLLHLSDNIYLMPDFFGNPLMFSSSDSIVQRELLLLSKESAESNYVVFI